MDTPIPLDTGTTRLVILCTTALAGVIVAALVILEAMGQHTTAATYASYISRGLMALVPILVTLHVNSKLSKGIDANAAVTAAAVTEATEARTTVV